MQRLSLRLIDTTILCEMHTSNMLASTARNGCSCCILMINGSRKVHVKATPSLQVKVPCKEIHEEVSAATFKYLKSGS